MCLFLLFLGFERQVFKLKTSKCPFNLQQKKIWKDNITQVVDFSKTSD